jgi:predicted TPR repeat methyltransferase
MNLETSPFSILNKERRELDYIKGVYKRRVQAEIDSYKDSEDEDEDKRDTIQAQDILMIDRIAI